MKHKGEDIREVWDWRLSIGNPIQYNSGANWVVKIHANDGSGVLEEYDTGIKTVDEHGKRNSHDTKAVAKCYDWLRSVRDKYSRDHIGLRKPVVKMINDANRHINELYSAGKEAEANQAMRDHNARIKTAISEMNYKILAGGIQ